MLCLGFEATAAGWQLQMDPLCYFDCPKSP